MDTLREQLENLKELRDLVRSLGRGGGWGPLRRAPVQVRDLYAQLNRASTDWYNCFATMAYILNGIETWDQQISTGQAL